MSEVTEEDQLLLEAYLDGTLDAVQTMLVHSRLESEPALAAEIVQLRSERATRRALFASMEPADADVQRFNRDLTRRVRRAQLLARLSRTARIGATAAACLLIGFMSGYVGRDGIRIGDTAMQGSAAGIQGTPVREIAGAGGGAGTVRPIAVSAPQTIYHVSLVDDSGQVLATQRFESLEQAREFAQDLGRWQANRRQVQNGLVQLVAERF